MKPVMARGKSLKWSHRPTSFLRAQFFSRYRKPPAPGSFGNIAVGNASWARGAAIYSSSLADYTWFSAVDMRRLHNGGFGCRKDCALVGRGRNLPVNCALGNTLLANRREPSSRKSRTQFREREPEQG